MMLMNVRVKVFPMHQTVGWGVQEVVHDKNQIKRNQGVHHAQLVHSRDDVRGLNDELGGVVDKYRLNDRVQKQKNIVQSKDFGM